MENLVDIEELRQDEHNFNKGTEKGQELMERSFKELGAGRSVLIDKNGNIIAGNKSQQAAIAAGIKKVRIIETDGTELVAVKRTDIDIDSKEGRELALADNLTTQVNLAWDEAEMQQTASDYGLDLNDWGVELEGVETYEEGEAQEDDFNPDEVKETKVKAGEVWLLGNHRLMCGDSTKREDVEKLMNGEQADLWITDPPYNVEYVGAKNRMLDHLDTKNLKHVEIENDVMSAEDYLNFLVKAFGAAASVMRAGCAYYIWYASTYHSTVEKAILDAGLLVKQQLIWNKNTMVLGWYDYKFKHEPCLYGWKEGAHYFVNAHNRTTVWEDGEEIDIDKLKKDEMKKLLHDILDNRTPTTVINEKKPAKSEGHPTMKPVRLFGYQIANSSRPGNIILDTFGGSGTTIVACEQLGRKARLMELDPRYCDVIIARWEKFTGNKAVKI